MMAKNVGAIQGGYDGEEFSRHRMVAKFVAGEQRMSLTRTCESGVRERYFPSKVVKKPEQTISERRKAARQSLAVTLHARKVAQIGKGVRETALSPSDE